MTGGTNLWGGRAPGKGVLLRLTGFFFSFVVFSVSELLLSHRPQLFITNTTPNYSTQGPQGLASGTGLRFLCLPVFPCCLRLAQVRFACIAADVFVCYVLHLCRVCILLGGNLGKSHGKPSFTGG